MGVPVGMGVQREVPVCWRTLWDQCLAVDHLSPAKKDEVIKLFTATHQAMMKELQSRGASADQQILAQSHGLLLIWAREIHLELTLHP